MIGAPPVQFAGDNLSVRFDRFGPESYDLFLRVKKIPEYKVTFDVRDESYTIEAPARFAELLGVERPHAAAQDLPLFAGLYDDQEHIVRTALDAKRFAVWSDCGLGKTLICLEFGRQVIHRTGGRFLVATVNEVVPQWISEAKAFYGDALPIRRLHTRQEMKDWCAGRLEGPERFAVTNYEKFNHESAADQVVSELRHLAGFAVDENRLKTGGGKQKWAIGKSAKGIEYKLSLTATPAPNNAMEFASQAMFLEKMRTEAEIIWTFFSKNQVTEEWDLRPHAREAFFRFMSSWSIYVRDPKRYGWRLTLPDVPAPEYIRVEVEPTEEQRAEGKRILAAVTAGDEQRTLFVTRSPNAIERVKLSEVAKGFVYEKRGGGRRVRRIPSRKPSVVTKIVKSEAGHGVQVLVWTVFDGESTLLAERLEAAGVKHEMLTGDTAEEERAAILDRFRRGESRVLVSRAALLGFGMNFQCVGAMVFSGWTDSYEAFYQAVRRAVRHGQTERVRIYLPFVRELEDETLANLDAKAARMEEAIEEMESNYLRATGRDDMATMTREADRQAERERAAVQVFRCRKCGREATRHEWPLRTGLMHCGRCGDMTLDLIRTK